MEVKSRNSHGYSNMKQTSPGVWSWEGGAHVDAQLGNAQRKMDLASGGGGSSIAVDPFFTIESGKISAAKMDASDVTGALAIGKADVPAEASGDRETQRVPVQGDAASVQILPALKAAFAFINKVVGDGGKVLVYCGSEEGQLSCALVAAWLMAYGQANGFDDGLDCYDDALAHVSNEVRKKPQTLIKNLSRQLKTWRKFAEFPGVPSWMEF